MDLRELLREAGARRSAAGWRDWWKDSGMDTEWGFASVELPLGDGTSQLILTCPRCAALVKEVHREGHDEWHKSLDGVIDALAKPFLDASERRSGDAAP